LRLAALMVIGTVGLGAVGTLPAYALPPERLGVEPSPNIVQVDRRCGEYRH